MGIITLVITALTLITTFIIGVMQLKATKREEKINSLEKEIADLKKGYKQSLNDWLFLYEVEDVLLTTLAKSNSQTVLSLKRKYRKPVKKKFGELLLNETTVNKKLFDI